MTTGSLGSFVVFSRIDISTKFDFRRRTDKARKHPAEPLLFVRLVELLIYVIYYTPDIAKRVNTLSRTHSVYEQVERRLHTLLEDLPTIHAWCNELRVLDVDTSAAQFSQVQARALDLCVMRMHLNMQTAFYILNRLEELQSGTRGFWDKAESSFKLHELHNCIHKASMGCKALIEILTKLPQFNLSTHNLDNRAHEADVRSHNQSSPQSCRRTDRRKATVESRSSYRTRLG